MRIIRIIAVVSVALAGSATRPLAQDVIDLPAGLACPNFGLRLEIAPSPNTVFRELKGVGGSVGRLLVAGKGNTLTFTNLSTGKSLTLKANGATEMISFLPDGSQLFEAAGHIVLIMFPTDTPAGPSTTLHVGRLLFTMAADSVTNLLSFKGTSTDICAALQ